MTVALNSKNLSSPTQKKIAYIKETLHSEGLDPEIKENVWPILEAGKFKPVIYKTFKASYNYMFQRRL